MKENINNPAFHGNILKLFTADASLQLPAEKNPVISAPLRLHDCSLISDGAAVVLAPTALAQVEKRKTVEIAGIGHAEDRLPIGMRANMYELEQSRLALSDQRPRVQRTAEANSSSASRID